MPEPLKNCYTPEFIQQLSAELSNVYPRFNGPAFHQAVFDRDWQDKELKQRMRHIALCLHKQLPTDYETAINILKPVSEKFHGYAYMFFQDFVECFGLQAFTVSMSALAHFTRFSSSEFAVRQFIIQDEKRMMAQMMEWAQSDNHHIRRLASEGCRPRLPWAVALPSFKKEPEPVFRLLKRLMNDESEYVRRSVANNLNDISKDHPQRVLDWGKHWYGKHPHSNWIIKHACRSLLKQGHPDALALFGYKKPEHIEVKNLQLPRQLHLGESLDFSFILQTTARRLGKLRIEYAIGFMKAKGKTSAKVFKISEADYSVTDKNFHRHFSFRPVSTRKYYTGEHTLSIIVNGKVFTTARFQLLA